jgi:23S rRNA (uracil1939-C5)-methyltransferase
MAVRGNRRRMSEILEIVKLGHAGDGIAGDGTFVPYTVPGDVVRVAREGARARVEAIIRPGPWRVAPPCRHFGRCGGCALQMVAREPYLAWKRDLVLAALKSRGLEDAPVEAIRSVGAGTRRRASFKARRGEGGIELGFYEPDSRNLVDLTQCPILVPELAKLMAPLRKRLANMLGQGETAELFVTANENGVDLSLKLKRAREPGVLMDLAEMALALKLARLSWNGEVLAAADTPTLRIGKVAVALPPDSFLQPTREGERILQDLVREEIGGAAKTADLFSGCGTFSFVLAESASVHAVDSSLPQIEALAAAARTNRARVTSETRDLFRRPLMAAELSRFDAVLLDPPRPGAQRQADALATSEVPRILYLSCNASTFARDARIFVSGGYRLQRVVPLDQFLWSPHMELFAVFTR